MRAIMLKHGSSFIRRNDMNAYRSSPIGSDSGEGADYTVTLIKNGVREEQYTSLAWSFNNNAFNSPLLLGRMVNNIVGLFRNGAFNQDIIIPENVSNCIDFLYGCKNFEKNVYFAGKTYRELNIIGAFSRDWVYQQGTMNRMNIFFNEVLNNIFNNYAVSFQSVPITFETINANCYYNSGYNLYFYHNYQG